MSRAGDIQASASAADQTSVTLVRIIVSLYGLAALATAADSKTATTGDDPYARMRAAMEASVEKQKASVRTQAEHAQAAPPSFSGGFFTVPWPKAVVPLAIANCEAMPPAQLDPLVEQSAKRNGVDPDLVRAIIRKESAAKPCAVSVKGAQGLMQLMPATAADYSVTDPFDPRQNVDAGTRFLKALLDKFKGDLSLALGAYNAGSGTVEKAGGIPDITETKDYVSDILTNLSQGSAPSAETQTSQGTKDR